jgi:hypothetical protein
MKQVQALALYNNATSVTVGGTSDESVEQLTVFGGAMLATTGITLMHFGESTRTAEQRKTVAAFLREWADAMEGKTNA